MKALAITAFLGKWYSLVDIFQIPWIEGEIKLEIILIKNVAVVCKIT